MTKGGIKMKITKIKSVRHINESKKIGVLELMSDDKLVLSEIPETINGFTIGTGSILRTPAGDFTIRGEEEWGAWRKRGEGSGGEAELPEVTSDDNGKVLKVVNGSWDKGDEATELPAVTSDDNGKILKVVNGAWAVVTPE